MAQKIAIARDIFYVGVNDRKTHLFENMWPLPFGVSYNSYLILDEKTALIDTVEIGKVEQFLKKVEIVLEGRKLDYLIINHMEPDHGGSLAIIRQKYPEVQIVGNKKTFNMIDGFFSITNGLLEVKEGDSLVLGQHKLCFYLAPMVHWPEVMVTYDETEKVLFSADAFGTFGTLDGGVLESELNTEKYWPEMQRYYSNIVGKYGSPVQKAIEKIRQLEIKTLCSTHGPVWQENAQKVIDLYDRYSRYEGEEGVVIAYGSMYGNTEQMAEVIARALAENGIKNIVVHDVSKSHASDILSDIFRYNALIVGSPTYSNELFPGVKSLLDKIATRNIKNRYFGYFGSFTWAGATLRYFSDFAENMKWEVVGTPVEEKMALKDEKTQSCIELGKSMAQKLKSLR
jgi:anaerobic nitric oxide reductase flavorubredoxin